MIQPVLGCACFVGIAWLLSENRRGVSWKLVGSGVLLQFGLAFLLLNFPFIREIFFGLNRAVLALEDATLAGSSFMFGYLAGAELPFEESPPGASFIIAFRVLPIVLVTSALSAVLFHWGVLQKVIAAFSFLLRRFMRAEGAMAFGVAANIFLGIIEAPLLIRPYLAGMSRSSLFTVITAGMATVAGTVMALYAGVLRSVVDNAAGQILVASIISVPAAVLIAQILIPSEGTTVPEETHELRIKTKSAFEALINGTLDGMRMVLNIAAVIIVLFAVISLVNQVLSQLSETLTLQWLVGWVFTPFCWLMGIPAGEAVAAGRLMATKTMLNEFVAYMQMAGAGGAGLSERTRLILTYAMCGFANFGSVGILVGGLGTILPDRKAEIVNLALRAIIAGTLATMMTGAVIAIVA